MVYTDVNKISIDINKHTVQKLRILHLKAVNQCIQRKVTTQALHHVHKLVTPNNKQYTYF
jgi:hypothetical protein